MAKIDVRYLVRRPGAGGVVRYFWQPKRELTAHGFHHQRVPLNWQRITDAAELEAAAAARCSELNRELDRWYVARTRGLVALPPTPAVAPDRTVKALIARYKLAANFLELAASTRRSYDKCLSRIEAWGGDKQVLALDTPTLYEWYSALRLDTPTFAGGIMRVFSAMLKYARLIGWIKINPATELDLQGADPSGIIWPIAAVDAFVARADALGLHSVGDAVVLNEWLGQRQGDVLQFRTLAMRDGALVFRQSKHGVGLTLPVSLVPRLVARLEAAAERRRGATVTATTIIACEATGQAWSEHAFRKAFAAVRQALGAATFDLDYLLPGRDPKEEGCFLLDASSLQFKHLRHTAVTRLAEAGATSADISSVTGHTLKSVETILSHYLVRTRTQAAAAFTKRLEAERLALPASKEGG